MNSSWSTFLSSPLALAGLTRLVPNIDVEARLALGYVIGTPIGVPTGSLALCSDNDGASCEDSKAAAVSEDLAAAATDADDSGGVCVDVAVAVDEVPTLCMGAFGAR